MGFIIGLFIGALITLTVMVLCNVAGDEYIVEVNSLDEIADELDAYADDVATTGDRDRAAGIREAARYLREVQNGED